MRGRVTASVTGQMFVMVFASLISDGDAPSIELREPAVVVHVHDAFASLDASLHGERFAIPVNAGKTASLDAGRDLDARLSLRVRLHGDLLVRAIDVLIGTTLRCADAVPRGSMTSRVTKRPHALGADQRAPPGKFLYAGLLYRPG
jgi:hypothetical protein